MTKYTPRVWEVQEARYPLFCLKPLASAGCRPPALRGTLEFPLSSSADYRPQGPFSLACSTFGEDVSNHLYHTGPDRLQSCIFTVCFLAGWHSQTGPEMAPSLHMLLLVLSQRKGNGPVSTYPRCPPASGCCCLWCPYFEGEPRLDPAVVSGPLSPSH